VALTTTAQVKTYLGVPQDRDPARWDALRVAAEATVKGWCKREFESRTYTEYLAGTGSRFLVLRHRPVISVTSVSEALWGSWGQGDFSAYVPLVAGSDYALVYSSDDGTPLGRSGMLGRLKGYWPEHRGYVRLNTLALEKEPGLGNVQCVYVAGYATIPDDVQFAVAETAGYMYRTSKRGGADYSERLGDHSYMIPMSRIKTAPELSAVRQILSHYRELPW
jgi:hypothetical protein